MKKNKITDNCIFPNDVKLLTYLTLMTKMMNDDTILHEKNNITDNVSSQLCGILNLFNSFNDKNNS